MKSNEFNQLNAIEQEELVFDQGFFIATHYGDDLVYDVYKIDAFYVQFSYLLNKVESLSIIAAENINELNSISVQ